MAYIEKDEALTIIENRQRELCPMGRYSRNAVYGSDREAFDNWQEILDEIEAIPSADAAPVRHGRWITKQEKDTFAGYLYSYECSECGRVEQCKEPYCNCGCKMDLEN